MSIVVILQELLETNLSIEKQCHLLEKTFEHKFSSESLFLATHYLYNLIEAPTQSVNALDIVGTGGDHKHLFNISTGSSFVIAGMDIPVLKHGNIKISSQSGSIDCLKALSVNIPDTLSDVMLQFHRTQLSFLFAQHFYSIFSKISEARKKLAQEKKTTIFNLLGPLLNPLRPTHQLIGVAQKDYLMPISETLARLNRKAFVFCCQGTDELIPGEAMDIISVNEGKCIRIDFDYTQYNLSSVDALTLKGGSALDNAHILKSFLQNTHKNQYNNIQSVILFNAAFAGMLYFNLSFEASYNKATESLLSGKAMKKLNEVTLP